MRLSAPVTAPCTVQPVREPRPCWAACLRPWKTTTLPCRTSKRWARPRIRVGVRQPGSGSAVRVRVRVRVRMWAKVRGQVRDRVRVRQPGLRLQRK